MIKLFFIVFCVLLALFSLRVKAGELDRIINGTPANPTPFHVHLIIRATANAPDTETFVGSGTLISFQHILSVAQNIVGFSHWTCRMGSVDISQLQSFIATGAIAHPTYNPNTLHDNIGIIVLNQQLPIPIPGIAPIQMPLINGALSPQENDLGTVVGFGFTHISGQYAQNLMATTKQVSSTANCIATYPHLIEHMNNYFCAVDSVASSNICAGDQGSGFTLFDGGVNRVFGLVSFSDCVGGQMSAFIRISGYRTWINQMTNI